MNHLAELFADVLIILAAGWAAGMVCRRFQVSLLIGYIIVGALIGAGALGWVTDNYHEIEYFAEAGVLFLLFAIGMEFSLEDFGQSARNIFIGGAVQMLTVALPAGSVLLLVGMPWQAALLLAFAVAMSSTVLVFKALAEYGETATPAGRRSIGVLLFQDIAVVPLLLMVSLLTGNEGASDWAGLLEAAAMTLCMVAAVGIVRYSLGRWLANWLAAMRSPELVVLFAIMVLSGFVMAGHLMGLPPPLGALAAGLALGGNRLTHQIDALVMPFRETFAAIFFVSLGLLFNPRVLVDAPFHIAVIFAGLFLLKSLAGMLAARATGLKLMPALGVGIGLSQVGEFAFVLAFAGLEAGLIDQRIYQTILVIALGSLILTPQWLGIGRRLTSTAVTGEAIAAHPPPASLESKQAIVIGLGLVGLRVVDRLAQRGFTVHAIDLSEVNLHALALKGYRTSAGDARDPQTLSRAGAREADIVVVCVPADDMARQVVHAIRKLNRTAFIIVRCRYAGYIRPLKRAGARLVISEEKQLSEALLQALDHPTTPATRDYVI